MHNLTPLICESAANLHLSHVEELVLNGGVEGARDAINFLRNVRDMLAGHSSEKVNATVKIDGAPALVCGIDPRDGKFFVAKKGAFNKNPKVYKTPKDIDADISSSDLSNKLKIALTELPKLDIKGVIQGDFLFTSDDLKSDIIDGEKYVVFHPNTIAYAIPYNSDLGKKIRKVKMGIVWHTKYEGNSFETMKATFPKGLIKTLKQAPSVWSIGVDISDFSGKASMTKSETEEVTNILSEAGKIFRNINATVMQNIRDDEEILIKTKTFLNSKVRQGLPIGDTRKAVIDLIDFIHSSYQKEIDKVKTEKSKTAWIQKRKEKIGFFSLQNLPHIENILKLMVLLAEAKELLVRKMNEISGLKTFLLTNNGYIVTGQEGYAITDKLKGNIVKFVNRLEFSRANFSNDVKKGWSK